MSNPLDITLHASAAETGDGVGAAVDIESVRSVLLLTLDVTAVTGTDPNLEVVVETSATGSGGWVQVGAFEAVAGENLLELGVGRCKRYVRARWTIEGTAPSFTFTLSGEAHVVYAGPEHVARCITDAGLEGISDSDLVQHCIEATAVADAEIRNGYVLPLVSWDPALTKKTAQVALWGALSERGIQMDGPDVLHENNAQAALTWLARVGSGAVTPDIVDSTPEVAETAAAVVSRPRRC